ncbi:MAG: hypothetical protein WCY02_08600 [Parvibaculum sp.]
MREHAARRLHAFAAIAILASAACVDDATSDRGNAEPESAVTATAINARSIEIVPLEAVLPTEAALFARLLAEETAGAGKLPVTIGGALGAGKTEGGTYVIAVIDITDKDGKPLHRLLNETTLSGVRPDVMSEAGLRHFAASTAERVSQWYAAWTPPVSYTLASTDPNPDLLTASIAPPRFRITIGPAPGDGARALTRALESQLAEQSRKVTWIRGGGFSIEGNVATASRPDGRLDVDLHWVLKSAEGRTLGEVHQKQSLRAQEIAGEWGELAKSAAEAAAKGVIAILEPAAAQVASRN